MGALPVLLLGVSSACNFGDQGAPSGAGSTTSGGTGGGTGLGSSSDDAADSSGGTPSACEALPTASCDIPTPLVTPYSPQSIVVEDVVLSPDEDCPCLYDSYNASVFQQGIPPEIQPLRVLVYRPSAWPLIDQRQAPFWIMHHYHSLPGPGNPLDDGRSDGYEQLMIPMAQAGIVGLSLERPLWEGGGFVAGREQRAFACAMEWARTQWEHANYTSCYATLAGHSRGGEGAVLFRDSAEEPFLSIRETFELSSTLLLGPLFDGDVDAVPLNPAAVRPELVMVGGQDNDNSSGGDSFRHYDRHALATVGGIEHGRYLAHGYGFGHAQLGGTTVSGFPIAWAGDAFTSGYGVPFMASHAYQDGATMNQWWSYATQDDYPPTLLASDAVSHWESLPAFTQPGPIGGTDCSAIVDGAACNAVPECWFNLNCTGDPVLLCPSATTPQDCEALGCTSVGTCGYADCAALPAAGCTRERGCAVSEASACTVLPAVFMQYSGDDSDIRAASVSLDEIDDAAASYPESMPQGVERFVDAANALVGDGGVLGTELLTGHRRRILVAEWGGTGGGELGPNGEIIFPMPAGLSLTDYQYLSLSVGNVIRDIDTGCAIESVAPSEIRLGFRRIDGSVSPIVSSGRIVQQDYASFAPAQPTQDCTAHQALHTIRFPLADMCDGFGTTDIDELVLFLPPTDTPSRVMVRDIQLLARPLDEIDTALECGVEQSTWVCEVDQLAITESACFGEPVGGLCDAADVRTSTVEAPWVASVGAGYRGWLVTAPVGAVNNPANPSTIELAAIRVRCAEACELEFSNRSEQQADCGAPDAFIAPTVVASAGSMGSSYGIAEEHARGQGLAYFEGIELDCDLRNSCCERFDENLCPARPMRPTEAHEPLQRGEEYVVALTGTITLDSPNLGMPIVLPASGTMGFSHCAVGFSAEPCAFYGGSMSVVVDEEFAVPLTCGLSSQTYSVDNLELALAQPGFGIHKPASNWAAFPPGSLVVTTSLEVDSTSLEFTLPSEDAMYLQILDGWGMWMGNGGTPTKIAVPCGPQTAVLEASIAMTATQALAHPPQVEIATPVAVPCPGTVALTKILADADGDIAEVRWYADGVLLDPSLTNLTISEAHTLRVVAVDARGATDSDTKVVACLP